jgi:hypothetical protein
MIYDGILKLNDCSRNCTNICYIKGLLYEARNGDNVNPKKPLSTAKFYICKEKIRTDEDLFSFEKRINKKDERP